MQNFQNEINKDDEDEVQRRSMEPEKPVDTGLLPDINPSWTMSNFNTKEMNASYRSTDSVRVNDNESQAMGSKPHKKREKANI